MLAKIFIAIMVFVTGLLPSSCTSARSKAPATPKPSEHAANVPTTPGNRKNLGDLTLTNHYETSVDLGAGKSCTIRPSLLDHHNVTLTMAFESKNSTGMTTNLNVVQITAQNERPLEIAIGDLNLTLTPKLGE